MAHARWFAFGGFAASGILVLIGLACIAAGIYGIDEVRNMLRDENIVAPEDSDIPGQLVDTGSEARAQADIMREHMLELTGGLTYAEMGRYATEDGDPAGTNNAEEAALDANGRPVANPLRNQWVTETALATSLNTAYFAEQVGLFSIVVGVALVLGGTGFAVLTYGTLWRHRDDAPPPAQASAPPTSAAPAA